MDIKASTERQTEEMIASLRERLAIGTGTTDRRGNVQELVIGFEDKDPQLSYGVVKSALDTFMNSLIGASQADSERSGEFLDQQIAEYEQRLEQAEMRLEEFKRENVGLMPQEGGTYFGRLQQTRDKVAEIELALREAERRRDQLRQQVQGFNSGDPQYAALAERIQTLRNNLDQMLLRYTENHPDVISAREQLQQLLEIQESLPADAQAGSFNSEYAQAEFGIALSRAEAEVASLRTRLEEFQSRQARLEEAINTIPQVEAKLKKLTRDYDVYRAQYQNLVERRESARISRDAVLSGDGSKFRLIEPPRVPVRPVKPDRLILHSTVLVFSIGAGLGLAFLMVLLKPTFSTTRELGENYPMPVLGSVGISQAHTTTTGSVTAIGVPMGALAVLLAAYGTVLYLDAL